MEEVIQVLVFIVIVATVIINKYKEVNANRPKQRAQQSKVRESNAFPYETDEDEEPAQDSNFQSLFDFEESDDNEEGFGGEFSKRNQKRQKDEPNTFSQSSSFEDLLNPFSKGLNRKQSPSMSETQTQATTETSPEETILHGETNIIREREFAHLKDLSPRPDFGSINHHTTAKRYEQTIVDQTSTSLTIPMKKKVSTRLKTKQEARQAFIYSEIFNRKYE